MVTSPKGYMCSEDQTITYRLLLRNGRTSGFNEIYHRWELTIPGRAPNKKRDASGRHTRLLEQYFGPDPVYNARDVRTRFRMTQRLFLRILQGVVETDSYFVQRRDATGKRGIFILLKVTAALRQLAYSVAADSIDENLELSASTALECVKRFCHAVIHCIGEEYLRPPNQLEMQTFLDQNAHRGFVGMIGSVDCMHWQWRICLSGLAGQYKAVADYNLRIWHRNFGSPGSLNDINVLDQSNLFEDFLQGNAPRVEYTVNGNQYYTPYLLADGIYPEWVVFVKSIERPRRKKHKHVKRPVARMSNIVLVFTSGVE
ncbi:Ribosomal protein [Phytophthora megakarya]|uniref:Ribosomal protein n=1 Tax=Phytophthora megakarya TaxID=4795 RepID=A0A225W4N7_9STRA|nr:Ribosomal protein [Phytophthora megakarya]